MKTLRVAGAVGVILLVVVLVWIPPIPRFPNVGLPFGYYGKLNRVRRAIEARPGVSVVKVAMHRDWALEDFWITVRRADGSEVRLDFESANVRSYKELAEELRRLDPPDS